MHKILLVEDDETIRQQVKKIMEQWGFEVIAVDDFMDVLGTFVQTNPHLILMDIGLPLYNGYHWCQEIRKVSKVPIMFLSCFFEFLPKSSYIDREGVIINKEITVPQFLH